MTIKQNWQPKGKYKSSITTTGQSTALQTWKKSLNENISLKAESSLIHLSVSFHHPINIQTLTIFFLRNQHWLSPCPVSPCYTLSCQVLITCIIDFYKPCLPNTFHHYWHLSLQLSSFKTPQFPDLITLTSESQSCPQWCHSAPILLLKSCFEDSPFSLSFQPL